MKPNSGKSTPTKIGGRLRGPKINMGGTSLHAIKEEDGENGSMNFSMNYNLNNQLTQEGDAEGQSQIDLAEAFNELERNDLERGEINFEN